MHCENFARIAKFFAILAKFSLCEIFASLGKFTVHSEISHFRSLVNFARLAKFR